MSECSIKYSYKTKQFLIFGVSLDFGCNCCSIYNARILATSIFSIVSNASVTVNSELHTSVAKRSLNSIPKHGPTSMTTMKTYRQNFCFFFNLFDWTNTVTSAWPGSNSRQLHTYAPLSCLPAAAAASYRVSNMIPQSNLSTAASEPITWLILMILKIETINNTQKPTNICNKL